MSWNESTYHIVFPSGDRKKLYVVEILDALSYELDDYAVASRKAFPDRKSACEYAKGLAKEHSLMYVPDDDDCYLD